MKKHIICISGGILILQTVCVSLIHATENDLTGKWCHSIYLNDRQFVTYKLFSLGIFA